MLGKKGVRGSTKPVEVSETTSTEKGQKYFDSGDYNLAKSNLKNKQLPTPALDRTEVPGDHIPTALLLGTHPLLLASGLAD
uniref:Endosulfine alpha n=1 Tax=Suricata suricatta TaxID=37032 RepID=A0A673VGA0_SURSU